MTPATQQHDALDIREETSAEELHAFVTHPSRFIRGWLCYMPNLSIEDLHTLSRDEEKHVRLRAALSPVANRAFLERMKQEERDARVLLFIEHRLQGKAILPHVA